MFGLCFGLAVKAYNSTGIYRGRPKMCVRMVEHNIEIDKQPVLFDRIEAKLSSWGQSAEYYKLLDACPLRMSHE